eukprot:1136972-Pelagomonas_calceolata.AAC.7
MTKHDNFCKKQACKKEESKHEKEQHFSYEALYRQRISCRTSFYSHGQEDSNIFLQRELSDNPPVSACLFSKAPVLLRTNVLQGEIGAYSAYITTKIPDPQLYGLSQDAADAATVHS